MGALSLEQCARPALDAQGGLVPCPSPEALFLPT